MLWVVISVSMIVIYTSTVKHVNNNDLNNHIQLTEKTSQQIDEFIEELNVLASQIRHQPEIINCFYELKNNDDTSNYFDKNVMIGIDISTSMRNLLINREDDYSICVYNNNGDFVSTKDYIVNKDKIENIINSEYKNNIIENILNGKDFVVIPPNPNEWMKNSSQEYITVISALKNDYSEDICGIIEVRGSIKKLSSLIDHVDDYNVIICDRATGNILYPLNFTYDNKINSYDEIAVRTKNANWEVVLLSEDTNTNINKSMIISFIAIYMILLIFMMQLVRITGRNIIKPLTQFTEHVRNIDNLDGNMRVIDNSAMDEIKELEKNFDKMLERMNFSIQQEKKAYSLALQAQMNPHFLYNTLAVIGSVGSENGCDDVTQMCFELSKMLRYVTEYNLTSVPLQDEIEHTKNYLSLMKFRYEDFFYYSIDVDDELLNMTVPKLVIQPLVENCFKHGFKDKEPPWNINVRIKGTHNKWKLVICDNGIGISDKRIVEVRNKISNKMTGVFRNEIEGLGLVNTIVRLKMIENENIKFELMNENGMKVVIISEHLEREED